MFCVSQPPPAEVITWRAGADGNWVKGHGTVLMLHDTLRLYGSICFNKLEWNIPQRVATYLIIQYKKEHMFVYRFA